VDCKSGRFWWFKAFGIFLICLMGWFVLVIWTGSALGAELSFAEDLRSRLLANYGIDVSSQNMRYLSLTILGEVFSDEGLTDESLKVVDALFEDPVPTATPNGVGEERPPTSTLEPSSTPDMTSTAEFEETRSADLTPTITATATNTATYTATSTFTSTPTATSTKTPTRTPKPPSTSTPTQEIIDDVQPFLICVKYHGGSEYEAIFGYYNPGSETQTIPVGDRNRFEPAPENRGQPTTFKPGEHNVDSGDPIRVFFDGDTIKWHLTSHYATASSSSPDCEGIFQPTATFTPKPIDSTYPMVGTGTLSPPQGPLTGCSAEIHVDNLHVEDEPYSSGIAWVKLKYVIEGYTSDLYSDPLTKVSGGPTGEGGWDAYYSGWVYIEINPDWTTSSDFYIKIYGKALDNAGYDSYTTLGSYTMPADCGSSPVPTATPTES
jgi:hypothetical protein